MAADEVSAYAASFVSTIESLLGAAAPSALLDRLIAATTNLANQAAATASAAAWTAATNQWTAARNELESELKAFLLDQLPDIPGLGSLADEVGWNSPEGLHGEVEIGPLKLAFSSSTLTVQPPPLPDGTVLPPFEVGPFRPSAISATIAAPIGGGLPGGGSIMRLANDAGFGGTLSIPLGPATVNATAVLERMLDGTPSFLAIMAIGFTPPIQLSFGFSLDRIGGLIGVNRTADIDALALAVRTGAAGDALFAAGPPPRPAALIDQIRRLFPTLPGRHLIGPTLRLAWLSLGKDNLVSLDLGVMVEIPTGKIIILGVGKLEVPGSPGLIHLRLDVLGMLDIGQSLASIDASLVDSHALGVFQVYGDGGMRLSWGSQAYSVLSIGGFYPGFNPEPAHLPALRRVGMSLDVPASGISVSAEGYLAVTSNTIQFGARLDIRISLGLTAHGFLQIDALVQFRPFHFTATCSAGFDVRAGGFSFGGVRLNGLINGPGPVTIAGKLTIETFLFDISWHETFTIGHGPGDVLPSPTSLIDTLAEELGKADNLRAAAVADPAVALEPRAFRPGIAAVPPTGALQWSQRRAPLGMPIDRVDGHPLGAPQGVSVKTAGAPILERFSPGSYCTLTAAEALNRPAFDVLPAGISLSPATAAGSGPSLADLRSVNLIVILGGAPISRLKGIAENLASISGLVAGSRRAPALSNPAPLITVGRESFATTQSGGTSFYDSATAAHQFARSSGAGTTALAAVDVKAGVSLAGI